MGANEPMYNKAIAESIATTPACTAKMHVTFPTEFCVHDIFIAGGQKKAAIMAAWGCFDWWFRRETR